MRWVSCWGQKFWWCVVSGAGRKVLQAILHCRQSSQSLSGDTHTISASLEWPRKDLPQMLFGQPSAGFDLRCDTQDTSILASFLYVSPGAFVTSRVCTPSDFDGKKGVSKSTSRHSCAPRSLGRVYLPTETNTCRNGLGMLVQDNFASKRVKVVFERASTRLLLTVNSIFISNRN